MLVIKRPLPHCAGGGLAVPDGTGGGVVVLDDGLTQRERDAVLTHELVHLERRGVANHPNAPACWRPVVAREERWTDDEAVRRLVPPAELLAFCVDRLFLEPPEATEPWHVADEFHVTEQVAERALMLLDSPSGAQEPDGPR